MNVSLAGVVSPCNGGDNDVHFAHTWVVLWNFHRCGCLPVSVDVQASSDLQKVEEDLK